MSVIVVGGGISGLSAAWKLSSEHRAVTLIDPEPRGGLLRTEQVEGCTVECGADSWIRTKPALRDLARELGLGADVIPCKEELRRTMVLRNGKLVPLPRGLRMVAPGEWGPMLRSGIVGWPTKLRMLAEMARRPGSSGDRTVTEFVADHFGDEAVEYLAEPLFAGVYGGAPENLGVAGVLPKLFEYERRYGSVVRGARRDPAVTGPLFESMREGLGQIPQALASKLERRGTRFISGSAEAWRPGAVRVSGEWIEAEHSILACGAPGSARLLAGSPTGDLLGVIPHSSATIFALIFRSADLASAPEGSGFLVPRQERRTILAGTWVTSKFARRAPAGLVVLRCFVSGDHSQGLLPDVLEDLRRITGVTVEPIASRVYRWPESMPQYGVGHARKIEEVEASLPDGVHLAGAFLRGVGMPDCVASGKDAATRVVDRNAT